MAWPIAMQHREIWLQITFGNVWKKLKLKQDTYWTCETNIQELDEDVNA